MNEQLQAKLLEWLNSGEAFVKAQAPEYVNQAMAFYAWDLHFDFYIAIAIILFGLAMFIFAFVGLKRDWLDLREWFPLPIIVGIIAVPFGVGLSISSYAKLKKIELAPKVFLVEKLTKNKCD